MIDGVGEGCFRGDRLRTESNLRVKENSATRECSSGTLAQHTVQFRPRRLLWRLPPVDRSSPVLHKTFAVVPALPLLPPVDTSASSPS